MKGIITLIIVAFLAVGGCGGGGGGGCDFDILSLANGPNHLQADSFWDCDNTLNEFYEFSIFENGTGVSTGIGVFTWTQTGCRSIEINTADVTGDVFNIDGSFQFGFLNYDEQLTGRPLTSATCDLVLIQ